MNEVEKKFTDAIEKFVNETDCGAVEMLCLLTKLAFSYAEVLRRRREGKY